MRHKHFLIFIRILIFCHDRNIWSRTVTDCLNNSFQKTCGFYYSYFAIQHQKQGYFQIYSDYYYSKLKKEKLLSKFELSLLKNFILEVKFKLYNLHISCPCPFHFSNTKLSLAASVLLYK